MAKTAYSWVFIIYNPVSTSGAAHARAKRLYTRLRNRGLTNVSLLATEYAGHAEQLSYKAACKYSHPLIISVSGDGGYNEVINGALKAQSEDASRQPVCAILAAGNANDHRRTVRKRPLVRAIFHAAPEPIDVLRLVAKNQDGTLVRYAHSYIGFGLTSTAAARLNRQQLNRWREIVIVAKTLLHFRFFSVTFPNGSTQRLDSLVFANIHRMSKVVRLGKKTNLHNGMFLVALVPHLPVILRFWRLLQIAIFGYKEKYRAEPYKFTIPYTQLVHFDGELLTLPADSRVTVYAAKEQLLTLR
jgi:diacylglycerol kinase (ATP)